MTIGEVLAPFGVAEDEFVTQLARELRVLPSPNPSGLTVEEESILRHHGGIAEPVDDAAIRQESVRSVSSNLAVLTRESLSVEQAADLLKVDASRVRHRLRDRALYGFHIGSGLRLPAWQFVESEPLPALRAIMGALPAGLHPLEVAGFMTSVNSDLTVIDTPISPRDWLIGGGDVAAVVALVRHLDEW